MARGITEADVWIASDALLLEGARPTIERVRQKIGRGSPNTVSPYLDTWFKHLGGRIKDPGAFSAPPETPDPVQQAAKHLWDLALAETRCDFDQRLQDGMAAAVANVEAEKERASLAEAAAFESASKAAHLQAELAARVSQLDQERVARATVEARLIDAQRESLEVKSRLDQVMAELAEVRTTAKQDVDAAMERAAVAERRAALEIDAQRVARAKADKRADAYENRLEQAYGDAREAQTRHLRSAFNLQSDVERLTRELAAATAAQEGAVEEVRNLNDLLAAAQCAAERAKGESDAARSALFHFEGMIPRARVRKRSARSVSKQSP